MAEEFDHGGVCGGNWWNSSRNLFSSSPCSSATNETGSFGWRSSHGMNLDIKTTRSSDNYAGSVSDWNQDLQHDTGRSEGNYSQILPSSGAQNSSMNHRQETIEKWNPKINTFCGDSSVNTSNFPMNSASYGYSPSLLLRTLFNSNSELPQHDLFDDQEMKYMSSTNFSNDQLISSGFPKASSMGIKPFSEKQQPFWNAMARKEFIPSTPSQYLTSGLNNFPSTCDQKRRKDESKNFASSTNKSSGNGPEVKHSRLETPSPLPTFKVRKEKLGDRITALQQLVSPFGKTDTASVLHEAIKYIKFLHDQVNVLSSPYLTNGSPPLQHQQDQKKDLEKDLSSKGLCLVPISSSFPVAAENTSDFWTPTFGRSFR